LLAAFDYKTGSSETENVLHAKSSGQRENKTKNQRLETTQSKGEFGRAPLPDSPDLLPDSPWELILLILLENQNQFVKSFGCKTDSYALITYNTLRYLIFYKLWLYKSGIIYINIT
jgi:hypothetical protein